MAMAAITEGLLDAGHSLSVLCMSTHKHPFNLAKVPEQLHSNTRMEAVEVDLRLKPLHALKSLIAGRSYNLARFDDKRFADRLQAILKEEHFDIIHLESLFCAPMLPIIRRHSNAKVVLRAHNVEHVIWQRLAAGEGNPFKREYLNILAAQLKAEELDLLAAMDGIATITDDDAENLRSLGITVPMVTVPMSLDISSIKKQPIPSGPLSLHHLGSMDWQPNVEGVNWFISEIWPLLHRAFPELHCHFAGRGMPKELLSRNAPPLHVHGEVDSAAEFAAQHAVAVVPLLSGSGMRIKIVEAMALGKVVISTSVGAEGIPFTDGVNILIADTPEDFLLQIQRLHNDPSLVASISQGARALAETFFDRKKVTALLTAFYGSL